MHLKWGAMRFPDYTVLYEEWFEREEKMIEEKGSSGDDERNERERDG